MPVVPDSSSTEGEDTKGYRGAASRTGWLGSGLADPPGYFVKTAGYDWVLLSVFFSPATGLTVALIVTG
jgi:hypothetical protein